MAETLLLNDREAASILGCTRWALARWRMEQKGPVYVRVGRLVRYRHAAILDWIEQHTVQTETTPNLETK
jgi:predicted DNA-binding transcriptional regulator AlpA